MDRGQRAALAGVLAVAAALVTTELAALIAPTQPSTLVAVQNWFVDLFGSALKDIAVQLFGTNHKLALTTGAVIVCLALAPWVGRTEAEHRGRGISVMAAFAVLGLIAQIRDPQGSIAVGVLSTAGVVVVGGATLLLLLDRFDVRVAPGAERLFRDRRPAPEPAGAVLDPEPEPDGPLPLPTVPPTRRDVMLWGLGASAVVVTGAALAKGVGDGLRRARSVIPSALPAPVTTEAVPASQPFSVPGLTPYVTPSGEFYRIDTAIQTPFVVTDEWTLQITGLVERPLTFTYEQLLARDLVEQVVTLSCVSNEVGGRLVGNAVWRGVPLRELLEEAGAAPEATQIVGESVDGFTAAFPTAVLDDPDRPALVAVGMNGSPLPRAHGFPARLVVSGLYGYVSATKWLSEIRLNRREDEDGYWTPRGWSADGPVKTQSRIDVPQQRARVTEGRIPIAGVAWAPSRGISKVEVRVDREVWQEAELGRVASDDTWVQWHLPWDATPGDHVIEVRATDGDGQTQPAERSAPAPDGATGWHTREVRVSAR